MTTTKTAAEIAATRAYIEGFGALRLPACKAMMQAVAAEIKTVCAAANVAVGSDAAKLIGCTGIAAFGDWLLKGGNLLDGGDIAGAVAAVKAAIS